jgi:hypothetical protein
MKILYITNGGYPDYLSDCILHGLYQLLGSDLTHVGIGGICQYMYADLIPKNNLIHLYGRGFTVYGTLPNYINDNSDIEQKIKNKYFDYIIYGSISRDKSYTDLVTSNYTPDKIAFIDGEDVTSIEYLVDKPEFKNNIEYFNSILYFKRELINKNRKNILPISFSIPKEKILVNTDNVCKIRKNSLAKPNHPGVPNSGYIYTEEGEYYKDYQDSYYGLTYRKAGWDCMRHYEILGNFCVPHFTDIDKLPPNIMTNFPKDIIKRTNILYDTDKHESDEYFELLNYLFNYTKEKLTTIESAKYVIDSLVYKSYLKS